MKYKMLVQSFLFRLVAHRKPKTLTLKKKGRGTEVMGSYRLRSILISHFASSKETTCVVGNSNRARTVSMYMTAWIILRRKLSKPLVPPKLDSSPQGKSRETMVFLFLARRHVRTLLLPQLNVFEGELG